MTTSSCNTADPILERSSPKFEDKNRLYASIWHCPTKIKIFRTQKPNANQKRLYTIWPTTMLQIRPAICSKLEMMIEACADFSRADVDTRFVAVAITGCCTSICDLVRSAWSTAGWSPFRCSYVSSSTFDLVSDNFGDLACGFAVVCATACGGGYSSSMSKNFVIWSVGLHQPRLHADSCIFCLISIPTSFRLMVKNT